MEDRLKEILNEYDEKITRYEKQLEEMEAKEKAKRLIQKFELIDREQRYQDELNLFEAKQCASICVDEIIKAFIFPKYDGNPEFEINGDEIYWLDVKKEVSLL